MNKDIIPQIPKPKNRSTLSWARYYLSKGFSVIPIKPKDKTPAIYWKEFQKRKPTNEELKKWFQNTSYNIGIVTGKVFGIAVVDLDSEEALKFAEDNGFPETPIVVTGEGYHLYYQYPADREVRNFQERDDLPRIDVRGDGGYVVAPPSIHPSGHVYEWGQGQGLDDLSLAEFPSELLLIKHQSEKAPLKELNKGVPEGSRNDSLFTLANSHRRNGLSFDECITEMLIWNERNDPPLPEDEVEKTVKRIYDRYDQNSVFQFPTNIYSEKAKKLDLEAFDYSLVLIKGKDLQKTDIKINWVIDKLLPEQSITLFHGRGGVGKTWLSLILGDAVSQGKPFMGLTTKKVPVYYIDFENPLPVLVERIKKLGIEEINFWHNQTDPKPPKIDTLDWEVYKKLPPGLIIIDTLRAFQNMDENDSRHMALVMARLKELRELGFTILLLHHTPKGNERIYKGSTAILDLSDQVLSLHRVDNSDSVEEEEFGQFFYFGTKDKTRYEPFFMYLEFDADNIFIKVESPDTADSEGIRKILTEFIVANFRLPNQSEVIDIATQQLKVSKTRVRTLLHKGEKAYWSIQKGNIRNQKFYEPVFEFFSDIYKQKLENWKGNSPTPIEALKMNPNSYPPIELLKQFSVWRNPQQFAAITSKIPIYDVLLIRQVDKFFRNVFEEGWI